MDYSNRHRTDDHHTSVEGAHAVAHRAPSQKQQLLRQFRLAAELGLTDEEAAFHADLLHACYWKRCNELRQDELIAFVPDANGVHLTRKGTAGVSRKISVITEAGGE